MHRRAAEVAVLGCPTAHHAAGGMTLPVVCHLPLEHGILATEDGCTNVGVSKPVCHQEMTRTEENKYGHDESKVVRTYQVLVAVCVGICDHKLADCSQREEEGIGFG